MFFILFLYSKTTLRIDLSIARRITDSMLKIYKSVQVLTV